MSVLEQARKVYERLKLQRNNQPEPVLRACQECAKSALSAKSPPALRAMPACRRPSCL
jgi:hypothetical protein